MNVQRKYELAKQAVNSISQHDDADFTLRKAVLTSLKEHIDAEIESAEARVAKKTAEALKDITPADAVKEA